MGDRGDRNDEFYDGLESFDADAVPVTEAAFLNYRFPGWVRVTGFSTTPPGDTTEDS